MEDKELHITLKCLFCGCDLKGDTEKKYKSGDMLKCHECGELNQIAVAHMKPSPAVHRTLRDKAAQRR